MHKKRGFTLIELLVVIALTMLIFATVGGTYIFMAQSQGNLLNKSSELFYAQNIADYFKKTESFNIILTQYNNYNENSILNLVKKEEASNTEGIWIDSSNGTLYNNTKKPDIDTITTKVVFTNSQITSCCIIKSDDNNFLKCYLEFKSGETFDFIIGKINP